MKGCPSGKVRPYKEPIRMLSQCQTRETSELVTVATDNMNRVPVDSNEGLLSRAGNDVTSMKRGKTQKGCQVRKSAGK